ncbi:uncharacterized protein TNCV_591951 [Trichonephila clavipes]|nr:uncharacterized protein TNCV_591951 [Trichonephila clavipes]
MVWFHGFIYQTFFFETQCPVNGDNGNGKCSALSNASVGDCRAMFNSTRSDFECHVHAGWSKVTLLTVKAFLIQTFGKDRIVSRRCRYPHQSPDLTPTDFWLWGYLKSCVYLSGPSSLSELKDAIRREVSSIHPEMPLLDLSLVWCVLPCGGEKLTVWCALWAGGTIGPYFFKNDEGHNVTVNGDRYRAMITNFFITELNNHDIQELWFQQDGATCHTARATIDLLKDTFDDPLISPVNWPPRSCDLTPLDYFLWGYVKSLVYADKPKRLTIWKTTFAVLLPIYGHKCWKKSSKVDVRLDCIRASSGSPMPENHI